MLISVNVEVKDFFRKYISILNSVLNLRKREADVLEAMLKVHYENRHSAQVNQFLFSASTMKAIRESLGLTVYSFNNHKHRLRQKKVLIGRSINKQIISDYPKAGKMNINFMINIHPNKKTS